MFRQIGPLEVVIILTIILLLFGAGRLSKVGRELGSAITEMRKGLKEGAEPAEAVEGSKSS